MQLLRCQVIKTIALEAGILLKTHTHARPAPALKSVPRLQGSGTNGQRLRTASSACFWLIVQEASWSWFLPWHTNCYLVLKNLSIHRSIDLFFYLSICLFVYLSTSSTHGYLAWETTPRYLFIYLANYPSISISIHPSIYPSIHLPIYLSIYNFHVLTS